MKCIIINYYSFTIKYDIYLLFDVDRWPAPDSIRKTYTEHYRQTVRHCVESIKKKLFMTKGAKNVLLIIMISGRITVAVCYTSVV